jgi:hypothetical protein
MVKQASRNDDDDDDDDNDDDDNDDDNNDDRSKWNNFKILQKILEQRTGKARYQGTTENSHIGHSTHTAESANVEAQKGLILQTALYVPLTERAEWLRHCIP